jgi:AcrR family transcriptional regulator
MTQKHQHEDLREACLLEAMAIIESAGIEGLSLREVSRRLGVSHQAPYKHFASRDHILAEIVSRTFQEFARHLDNRPRSEAPHADLEAMGYSYLTYALENPLQYRLLFGTPLPDPEQHPAMMASAQHAFALLRDCIARMALPTPPELDALFVWSTMHGFASMLQTEAFNTLALPPDIIQNAVRHAMARVDSALSSNHPKA